MGTKKHITYRSREQKLRTGTYLIIFLMASLLVNCFQFYEIFKNVIPRAAYVSFVGVDKRGYCVTGQEFLNYDTDSKAEIVNTIMAISAFQNIERVVLINKWTIKNDLSEPPEVKLLKR